MLSESVAMGDSLTANIYGNLNPKDLLKKVLWSGKQRYLMNNILCGMYNGEFKLYAVAK